ncbi:MAG: M3 family metallopeptidase [Duodenibacillus sp.]|nr:M3 family metallopeptidase [Duodenibacillus sp.]
MTDSNPLLSEAHCLDFAAVEPRHVGPAVDEAMRQARDALARATAPETPADWEHVVEPLSRAVQRLGRAWGATGHLMGVMDSPELREAYNAKLPEVSSFYIALSQDEALFSKYKAMAAAPGFADADPLRRRVVEHEIRDFRLSGAELPDAEKARVKELGERLSAASQRFSEHLLDATDAFGYVTEDEGELAGVPEDVLALYAMQAEAAGAKGWRVTLQYPSYIPLMRYADNRELRRKVYTAFMTRASELGPAELDNTPVIGEILALRRESARLLGFASPAEESLATKMADTPAGVVAFLRDLARRSRPWGLRDNAELEAFAARELGIDGLEPWDVAWASEKLRSARYSFSAQEVRRYFTLPAVLSGLFKLVEGMFGIAIEPAEASVWHPDVRFWRVADAAGGTIAHFYTDLYARPGKRSGAWMDSDLSRERLPDGTLVTPTAYLVCNFAQPVGGKPATLTHEDVTTLFHEFGHGLHHMLTRVDVAALAGINGVEWDAVEMPSQFMENWAWSYEVLASISRHADTGEPLPRGLFEKMLAAKNFQSGLFSLRQIEFGLFDMLVHGAEDTGEPAFQAVLDAVRSEVAVRPAAPFDRFAQSFSHIFAGGYGAGYYSYKWAEVLSADAFSAFEEEGLFNPATGRRWLDEVLARGASRDAMDSFKAFRGRAPAIDALLRHTGMAGDPPAPQPL